MNRLAEGTCAGTNRDQSRHWSQLALQWSQVGPPLRPAPQGLGFYWGAVREWVRGHGAPRVLLVGVTPELYHLP